MLIARVADRIPAIQSKDVGLHEMRDEEFLHVLVGEFLHCSVNGHPQGLNKCIVDPPLINQAIHESFCTSLGVARVLHHSAR